MKQQHIGTLFVLASAAGFGTLAIFIKMAYAAGANTFTILTLRFLLAAIFLWLTLKPLGISPRVTPKMLGKLFLMGTLGYGSTSFLFTAAIEYLPASLAEMLLFTYPVIVSILSFMIGTEKFSWLKGLALGICTSGLFLILGASFDNLNHLGVALGLGAAIIYSFYILISERVLEDVHPLVATTYVCSGAALFFLVYTSATGQLMLSLSWSGWLAILGIASLGTIVGILCLFAGISCIGPTNSSIIGTFEPLVTVILSTIVLGEKLTILQITGGLLIIGSIIFLQKCATIESNKKNINENKTVDITSY